MENLKFENVKVYNFEMALRGMRNPKNSWHLSDSAFGMAYLGAQVDARDDVAFYWVEKWKNNGISIDEDEMFDQAKEILAKNGILHKDEVNHCVDYAYIGPKDMRLAQVLINGGSEHRKFLRQILVTVDITAPLFW